MRIEELSSRVADLIQERDDLADTVRDFLKFNAAIVGDDDIEQHKALRIRALVLLKTIYPE